MQQDSIRYQDSFNIPSKEQTFLNLFFIGLILYSLSYVIKGISISQKIGDLVQLASIATCIASACFLIKFKIKNSYLKFLFTVYIVWALIVIARGIRLNFKDLMYMLLSADLGGLLYFIPLVLLFPQNLAFYRKLFDAIIVLGLVSFVAAFSMRHLLLDRSAVTQNTIEYLARMLSMPCGFILLTYKYHSNKRKLIALAVMLIALLFSVYKARRGLSITLSSIFIFSFFLFLFTSKQKILILYLTFFILCIGGLYTTNIYNINNNALLNKIADRADEDTRSGAELYFYNDMQTKDWIIGRGMNGEYFCPGIDDDPPSDYRTLMETGYLQIILKGGLVRLALFILIAGPAFFLGLFASRNILSKASAIWIMVALLSLYPATVESISFQYLIVWISIGVCYSKQIRTLSDTDISSYINEPRKLFFN